MLVLLRATLALVLLAPGLVFAQAYETLPPYRDDLGTRVALVLGNADYEFSQKLQNPRNDADDLGEALRRTGFTVVSGLDLRHEQMDLALIEFARLARGADVAMFFYAGHGVQVMGENFLLPVDANIQNEVQVARRSVALGEVMDYLNRSEATLKIVVLDACRDNPFQNWRSASGGWAATEGPSGSFVAYGTSKGSRASDNIAGRNGLYTAAILEEIERPGVELAQTFKRVYNRVYQASSGSQEPSASVAYFGSFYFVPQGDQQAIPQRVSSPDEAPPARALTADDVNEEADEGVEALQRGDMGTAVSRLQRAADLGHAGAQSVLGYLYQKGLGVDQDHVRAAELYRLAADQGHPAAQTNLAVMLERGMGVTQDEPEAVRLYRLAADQGRPVAMNNLGVMLQNGRGVEKDEAAAAALFRQAGNGGAPGGLPAAIANYAFMLEHGLGVPQDEYEAFYQYFQAAAREDHVGAQYRLGRMYMDGRGVRPADPVAGQQWLTRAARATAADG